MRSRVLARWAGVLLIGLSCSDGPTEPEPIARITVSPTSLTLASGASATLTAVAVDAEGRPLQGRLVAWSSADTAIAAVTAGGIVTARNNRGGEAVTVTITAQSEGRSGSVAIQVLPVPVARVVMLPDSVLVRPGTSTTVTLAVEDATGASLSGRSVTYAAADTGIARVGAQGQITGAGYLGPELRQTRVIATVEGKADTTRVFVSPVPVQTVEVTPAVATLAVGATQSVTVVTRDSTGTALVGRSVTWASSDTTVVRVASAGVATAQLTAVAYPGTVVRTATVTATRDGRSASVAVTVTPATVARVAISPDSVLLPHGQTRLVSAAVLDGANQPLTGRALGWRSLDTLLATIDAQGAVTALTDRPWLRQVTAVVARVEDREDSAAVVVTPWALRATPASGPAETLPAVYQPWAPRPTTAIQGALQYGDGAGGNLLGCEAFPAGSLNGKVVLVDRGSCTFSLKAENIGRAGALLAIVREVTIGGPPFASAFGGGVVTVPVFMVSGGDGSRLLAGSPSSVVRVDPTIGPATPSGAVAWVAVSTSSDSVIVGTTRQLSVALSDWSGATLTGRAVTWATSDATVATVSPSGLVTPVPYQGGATRRVTITATSEGRTGIRVMSVLPIPVSTISISPSTATIAQGATQQLTAVMRDATGAILTGRASSWSSADTGKATVSPAGLVTARAASRVIVTASSEGRSATATVTIVAPDPCTAAGATLLTVPETFAGSITGADCAWTPPANSSLNDRVDLYRFSLTARTAVVIDMARGTLANPYLYLADAVTGDSIAANDEAPGGSADARVAATLMPGTYLIRATGAAAGDRGTYSLRLTGCRVGVVAVSRVKAGDGQAATPGGAVAVAPAIEVLDECGNGVSGVPVTFAAVAGVGSISGASAITDAAGVATLGSWTLATGPNVLAATLGGAANASILPVMFSARGDASTAGFDIHLRFTSLPTTNQLRAFAEAVARWESVITGDLPDVSNFNLSAESCLSPTAVQLPTLDDLVIVVRLEAIDGVNNFLAFAGPCVIRTGGLSSFGYMRFDLADLPALETRGSLRDVVLHEMGHVLGIGTLWSSRGFLQLASTTANKLDTHFNGPEGILGFDAIGGTSYTGAGQQVPGGAKVPVENCTNGTPTTCGSGTINAHWREGVLQSELMTGYLNTAAPNPLSLLTVRSLRDLGYVVDITKADAFVQSMSLQAGLMSTDGGEQLHLMGDAIALPLLEMGLDGRILGTPMDGALRPTRRSRGGR